MVPGGDTRFTGLTTAEFMPVAVLSPSRSFTGACDSSFGELGLNSVLTFVMSITEDTCLLPHKIIWTFGPRGSIGSRPRVLAYSPFFSGHRGRKRNPGKPLHASCPQYKHRALS